MRNFSLIVLGLTAFMLGIIWKVSSGEAGIRPETRVIELADTIDINIDETLSDDSEVQVEETRESFLKEVKKLNNAVFDIKNRYMEDIDTEDLVKAGIRGMLRDLDRFSVLMERQSYERLMESTSGKYEGLGMEIDSRGDYISVVTPMEGTPAYRVGLRPGDQIQAIDGKSTYNMSTSDAASLMRGKAGTSVVLTVMRNSFAEPIDFEVERAVIELKSVNYYGVIDGTDIGYVRLSRFAEETSNELREAISELNNKNIGGLIFDLRSNGGGLLTQAVETAELFLNEGSLIVYTRGKNSRSVREHHSQRVPLYPDKPLVILVNEGTASASEIVSGAVQDWDRGVIMGYPTYGKGLVQQVFPIGNDDEIALKLTTAKYYIPSGRCIQKSDNQQKRHPGDMTDRDIDSAATDSIEIEEKEIYYTNGGRPVYGGGGILPDVELEDEDYLGPLEINLERDRLFFDYAVEYVGKHPQTTTDIEITDDIIKDFRRFMEEKEFSYKTSLEVSLDEMKEIVTENGTDSLYGAVLDKFADQIGKEKEADFNKAGDYLKRAIKRELAANIAGERGVYEHVLLKTDKAIKSAMELLQDKERYAEALKKGHLAATETSNE